MVCNYTFENATDLNTGPSGEPRRQPASEAQQTVKSLMAHHIAANYAAIKNRLKADFFVQKILRKMKLFAGLRGIIDEMHFKREAGEV